MSVTLEVPPAPWSDARWPVRVRIRRPLVPPTRDRPAGMWDEAETWHDAAAMEEDLVDENADGAAAHAHRAAEEDGVEMHVG